MTKQEAINAARVLSDWCRGRYPKCEGCPFADGTECKPKMSLPKYYSWWLRGMEAQHDD